MNAGQVGMTPAVARLLAALNEFREAPDDGEPLAKRFKVRTMKLNHRPSDLGPADVRRIRREVLRVSPRIFAGLLGVNPDTVRAWEQGPR